MQDWSLLTNVFYLNKNAFKHIFCLKAFDGVIAMNDTYRYLEAHLPLYRKSGCPLFKEKALSAYVRRRDVFINGFTVLLAFCPVDAVFGNRLAWACGYHFLGA